MDYIDIQNLFCDIKGYYLDIIILYHGGKVSYSDITIEYPGIQMPDTDFKLLHLLFYCRIRQVYYTIFDIIITYLLL